MSKSKVDGEERKALAIVRILRGLTVREIKDVLIIANRLIEEQSLLKKKL